MSKQWIPAAAVGTLLGVAAWKEHKTIQGAMGDGRRADKKFAPGEILLLDSPHTRGLFPPTKVNFRGYYGAEDAVVVQDGRQMTIKVAWLSRIKGQRAKGGKRGKAQRRYHVRYWNETDKDWLREGGLLPETWEPEVLLRTDKEDAAWAKVNELEEDQMDYEGIQVFDTARQEVIWESPPKGPTIRDPWARLGGFAARGRQAKINYRRKHKARSYRHRDTVRAKLLQDEANTKRRREDRKSASEGRQAKASEEILRSYGYVSEMQVLESLHLQALETCDQTYADYAPPAVLRGLERKGYITRYRGTADWGNWSLTSKGLKWADKTWGLDGKRGRRAKSKRDFVKQVWERQAPTMTGGPLPPPIPGMEGPFRFRSGKILYWDPKEGKYYDRGRDMYVEVEDVEVAMSGRRAKSHNRRVSKCISGKVRGEGWDQRQAVGACLNMDREGRLRADGSYKRK